MKKNDATKIYEVTLSATILMEARDWKQARQLTDGSSLQDFGHDIDEGDCLGMHKIIDMRELAADNIENRQIELGSDGSFFPNDGGDAQVARSAEGEILRLQLANGLSAADLSTVMMSFLRDSDLQHGFVGYLEKAFAPKDPEVEAPGL